LLYPVVFNINLFDFHPEVIALPALLGAILAARLNKVIWFCSAVLLVLSCKAVLSLTVAAIGFWLLLCEKKQRCGAIALLLGVAWFAIASQKIIPLFSGSEVAGVGRYSYLGKSVLEIAINLVLKPQLVLGKVLSFDTLKYIFVLSLPVIWGLLPFSSKIGLRYLTPLIPAIPTLAVNILSDLPFQRSLAYQYSVPIIPFLLLAVISKEEGRRKEVTPPYPPQGGKFRGKREEGRGKKEEGRRKEEEGRGKEEEKSSAMDFVTDVTDVREREAEIGKKEEYQPNHQLLSPSVPWGKFQDFKLANLPLKISKFPKLWLGMQLPKTTIVWSLIIFLFLGEYKDFFLYLNRLDTWQATREAIAQIQPQSSILTDNRLAPHFAHRPIVKLLSQISPQTNLAEFEYILLNQRHPWPDTAKVGNDLANRLQNTPQFQLAYQKNQVLLFKRIGDS
jgi:uncharacterized membrane protein